MAQYSLTAQRHGFTNIGLARGFDLPTHGIHRDQSMDEIPDGDRTCPQWSGRMWSKVPEAKLRRDRWVEGSSRGSSRLELSQLDIHSAVASSKTSFSIE